MDAKRKAIPKSIRMTVYQKCNGHCAYCGCNLEYRDMQVDHVIPLNGCYKRGACPVVKCNLPEFQLADMISVHDLKDYGDCDEEIYRQLFLDGCYRLEINIPGENGILSKKIYYLKPEPPKNSIELIPISYQDFLKWKL